MAQTIPTIFNISLAKLPMPAKLLFTAVLLTLGTGYIFAIANIALKVGFTSEEVATTVLNYDPIPGENKPCIPLEEVGGKVWAL